MDAAPPLPAELEYPAEFLDGWSLAEQHVRVFVQADGLRIVHASGRTLGLWSRGGLIVDAMQEGGVLHASHDSARHETLVISHPALARLVQQMAAQVRALPGGSRKLAFALVCLVALLAIAGMTYALTPRLAQYAASKVPLSQERALGAQIELLLRLSTCRDDQAEAVLKRMLAQLSKDARRGYEVHVIRSPEPNAFALPGGVIVVTETFLHQAKDGDEIAGVLAHEVEHIAQRHVLAGFLRDAILTGLWSLTAGDYAGLLMVDPSTAYRIANLQFSREDEASADAGATRRLHAAGLSHRGLESFFARLLTEHGEHGPDWLSTHPSTRERIAALAAIPDVKQARPALTMDELDALRAACRSAPQ